MKKWVKTSLIISSIALLMGAFCVSAFGANVTSYEPSPLDVVNNIKYTESPLLPLDKITPEFCEGYSVTRPYFTTLIRFEKRCDYVLSSGLHSSCDAIYLRWAYDDEGTIRLILAQTQYFDTSTQSLQKRNTFFVREVPESWGAGFTQTESYTKIFWRSIPKIAFVNGQDMGRATMDNNAMFFSANYVLFGRYASDLYSGEGLFYPTYYGGGTTMPPEFLGGFSGWLFNVLDNILSIRWFGWFSIGTLLGCFFAIGMTILFLKMFAGG